MSEKTHLSRFRRMFSQRLSHSPAKGLNAFFSFDAAFALLFACATLLMFIMLASAAGKSAQDSSERESGNLLALRLSSEVLLQLEEKGGVSPQAKYSNAWVVDPTLLPSLNAEGLASRANRNFTRVSIHSLAGEAFSSSYGQQASQAYCANRLALMGNEPVRLEVCIS
jgi:hypothetical protein